MELPDTSQHTLTDSGNLLLSAPLAAIPVLRDKLTAESPRTRWAALKGLGYVARGAVELLPEITPLLDDDIDEVRVEAAVLIGRMGWNAKNAVSNLQAALHVDKQRYLFHGATDATMEAARALGRLGPFAESVLDDLKTIAAESIAFSGAEEARRAIARIEGQRFIPWKVRAYRDGLPGRARYVEWIRFRLESLRLDNRQFYRAEECLWLEKELSRERRALEDLMLSTALKSGGTDACPTNKPCAVPVKVPQRSTVLARRHNTLVRAAEIGASILALRDGRTDLFAAVRARIRNVGAFLSRYSVDEMRRRITSPRWIVFEAGSKVGGSVRMGADCQCFLAPDDPHVEEDPEYRYFVELPDMAKGDYFIAGKEIAEDIKRHPACAGCVADICSEDDLAHSGMAGEARQAAFELIVRRNAQRAVPIRYMLAEVFSVTGVIADNGDTIRLKDFNQRPLANHASIMMHVLSMRTPAMLGWTLVNREVPDIQIGSSGSAYRLLVDWFVLVHELRTPTDSNHRPDSR